MTDLLGQSLFFKEEFSMGPKYIFTGETKNYEGRRLNRICRLSDGKLGGWIESEKNLSQEGNCWVDDEAIVCDYA